MNYRSVAILDTLRKIVDPTEKVALKAIVEHTVPNRWEDVRWPIQQELKAGTDVRSAYERYALASDVVARYSSRLLQDADEVLEAKLYGYSRGSASLLEVLEARRANNDIYLGYQAALNELVRPAIIPPVQGWVVYWQTVASHDDRRFRRSLRIVAIRDWLLNTPNNNFHIWQLQVLEWETELNLKPRMFLLDHPKELENSSPLSSISALFGLPKS